MKNHKAKEFIKAVVPRSVLNRIRGARDCAQLAMLPSGRFDAANLRKSSSVRLPEIFCDRGIEAAWEEDHKAIVALFADLDRYGGVNPGDRRALYYLIMALKPRNVLEVGTHIGASMLYIARALKRFGGAMTSVDIVDVNRAADAPWKQLKLARSPEEFAAKLGCAGQAAFHTGPSLDFMRGTKEKFDLVFLDGDHSAHAVYQEAGAALSILAPGGVILLHDYYPEAKALYPDNVIITGPFQALARVGKENPAVTVMPLGMLPWPTKQGTNATSLALAVKK